MQAYDTTRQRIVEAGCEVLREVPAREAGRPFDLPPGTELVLVLTTWAGHTAIDQVRATLKSMDDPPQHVFSPHQWSRLKPHLDRVGVVPMPAPVERPAAPQEPQEHPRPPTLTPDPEPAVDAAEEPSMAQPDKPERDPKEALSEAVLNLVAEMRAQNIQTLTVNRDGKVELQRVVITNETIDLEL